LTFPGQLRKLKLELTSHRQKIIQMSQNFLIKKQHQLTKPQERFEIL
jgi:hypothetical protein